MNPDTIAIAASIDDRYALPLAVMLDSLVRSLRPPRRARLHLLHRGLSDRALDALAAIVETHGLSELRLRLPGGALLLRRGAPVMAAVLTWVTRTGSGLLGFVYLLAFL